MPNEVLMDALVNLAYSGGGFVLGYLAANEAKLKIPNMRLRLSSRKNDKQG